MVTGRKVSARSWNSAHTASRASAMSEVFLPAAYQGGVVAVAEAEHDAAELRDSAQGELNNFRSRVAAIVLQQSTRTATRASIGVDAGRKLTSRGCGEKLGLVKQRSPGACGTQLDCGSRATS